MRFVHARAGIDVNLADPSVWRDPRPVYARLRAAEGLTLCHQPAPLISDAWAVTRYEDVSAVLKDVEHFRNDPHSVRGGKSVYERPFVPKVMRALMRSMVFVDDLDHRRLRRLVSHAFTPKRLHELERSIEALSEQLLREALAKRSFDFIADFALPLPLRVIAQMLGVHEHERREFHSHVQANSLDISSTWGAIKRSFSMYGLYRFFKRLIARKRAEPGDDITSALIAAEDEGDHLAPEELLGTIFLLLFAGHETTVNLLGTGTATLLTHRAQLERLLADPAAIPVGIEEMLRIVSPAQLGSVRYVAKPVELGGHSLVRGDTVVPIFAAANLDERVFEDAERFDVGRTPNHHLAFGGGPHFCVGAHLTRLEGRLAFSRLIPELDRLELACAPEALRWRSYSSGLRGLESLPLRARRL